MRHRVKYGQMIIKKNINYFLIYYKNYKNPLQEHADSHFYVYLLSFITLLTYYMCSYVILCSSKQVIQ